MRREITISLITGLFIFILSIIVLSSINAKGATINVPEDYSTIQAAIDNADETNNTIHIHSGTYYENILINKTLTIYGDGSSNTEIYPEDSNQDVIKISSDNVDISKLKITQNEILQNSGIYFYYSDQCSISQCTISKFSTGIYIKNSNENSIDGCIIQECHDSGIIIDGSGSYDSNNNNIINNEIKNNDVYGLYIEDQYCNNNNIHHNDFFYNDQNAFEGGNNNWDDGSEGNNWSDYGETDSNGDGIGESQYNVPGGGVDHYPTGYFVNAEPTAHIVSILPSSPEEGDTIHLTGDGSDDGYIIRFEWKIDGSDLRYGENVDITGLSVGTHTVSLRVKDNDDEWSSWTETQSFTIQPEEDEEEENQKPVATIGLPDSPTITKTYGETITFLGSGTDPDGEITGYKWEDNNELLSYEKYFYCSNLSVGTHSIYFKVKDNRDEWSNPDQVTVEITQNDSMDNNAPTAVTNGPYNSYVNQTITFDASNSVDDGTITSYSWNFGDGANGSGKTVTHSYQNPGEYTVVLTVTDNNELSSQTNTIANILSSSNEENINNGDNENEDNNNTKDDDKIVIPGFEVTFFIVSLISLTAILNRKRKK